MRLRTEAAVKARGSVLAQDPHSGALTTQMDQETKMPIWTAHCCLLPVQLFDSGLSQRVKLSGGVFSSFFLSILGLSEHAVLRRRGREPASEPQTTTRV